jgi:hypothetical protein
VGFKQPLPSSSEKAVMEIQAWRKVSCVAILGLSGCSSLWHHLQPEQLHKWNSGPPPFSDPQFTMRDSVFDEPVIARAQNPKSSSFDLEQ